MSETVDDRNTWSQRRVSSDLGPTRFFALAPGCPDGPHATRGCECKSFKTHRGVSEYIKERQRESNL